MKQFSKRILSMLLAVVMLLSLLPTGALAAPASDLPENMTDSPILRALEYTGYDVQKQKEDGTLYQSGHYGQYTPGAILSGINYGISASGKETVDDSSTVTGKAPDIAAFQKYGLCCASFVTYYFSYLINIEGADAQFIMDAVDATGWNPQAVVTWQTALNNLVSDGVIEKIGTSQNNVDRSKLAPGDVVTFGNAENSHVHIGIYSGTYNGTDYMIHVGNDRGPEIIPIHWMNSYANGEKNAPANAFYHIPESVIQSTGKIEVFKANVEDAPLPGAYFTATSTADPSLQYLIGPTDSNGYASVEGVKYSEYIIRETVFPENYQAYGQTEWTLTLDRNTPNGTLTVYAVNELAKGSLQVTKTAEDGFTEDIQFHLYGTAQCGEQVDMYAVTNANGIAVFEDVLIGTEYIVEEVNTDIRYVIPESQTVSIVWNEVTNCTFENRLKKFRAEVFKLDEGLCSGSTEVVSLQEASGRDSLPYGQSQGDAALENAVYGLYKGGELLAAYTTDEKGFFVTDYFPCDDDYYLQEITSSEGYLLDSRMYYIYCPAQNYTEELNTESVAVYEEVITGRIEIAKHTDDGETKIETPEAGAEFEVYLKSAGSYDAAQEYERDIMVIGEDGFATSKKLPYGTYVVTQKSGWEGRDMIPSFEVVITEDEHVYRYIINNAEFASYIKVTKTDTTTGKIIPYANAAFRIYDPEGKPVTMQYTYPQVTTVDTFYTTADGTLVTPETLPYGKGYSLVEVQATNGYVLDPTPVYFDVMRDTAMEEDNIIVVNVVKGNMPQMGTVTVTKTGEVFASVIEKDGMYQPVFETAELEGAVIEIYAAEDIVTPDGTVRYTKGEKVDTITSGADGTATSKELYLGSYRLKEIEAPYGMLLGGEPIPFALTYAGQEISVTSAAVSVINERQKLVLDLIKALEQDETFHLGMNGEVTKVSFGLYAADTLTAADGTQIPKDGLLEIAQCDSGGKVVFTTDVPVDSRLYVKEVSTDPAYLPSEVTYPVEFVYAGQEVAAVVITVNDGAAIENKLIRGSVEGLKKDEDGNAVAGAEFGLFRADTTELVRENAFLIATSDDAGVFRFENLPAQKFIIKELSAPEQYVLTDEVFAVEIIEDGQIATVEIINEKIPEQPETDNPKTGDTANIAVWAGLMVLALLGMAAVIVFRRRANAH